MDVTRLHAGIRLIRRIRAVRRAGVRAASGGPAAAPPAAGRADLRAPYVAGFHDPAAVRAMPYRQLGPDRRVSALSLGGSALAGVYGRAVDAEEAVAVVRTAVRRGVNMIDTAPWY